MNLPPAPMWTVSQPPFTAAQWQELEHQALIFKYLKAGLTVPPDLLISIHNSLLRHHSSLGYYSYYGKKIDPEPGRCRRTDGKKWRCSRDACLDSKYCERHMLRRRYRSRKPVESSSSQSAAAAVVAAAAAAPKSSIEVVAAAASGGRVGSGSGNGSGSFQSLPMHATGVCEGFSLGNNHSFGKLQMESFPDEVRKKEFRFGLNFEADEHNFISKDLGNAKHQDQFSSDAVWSHMSQISSNSVSESGNGSIAISNCFQQQRGEDAKPLNIAAARSEQHVTSGHLSLSSAGCLKQEYQSPPSLFSDWHWKKDFGSSGL